MRPTSVSAPPLPLFSDTGCRARSAQPLPQPLAGRRPLRVCARRARHAVHLLQREVRARRPLRRARPQPLPPFSFPPSRVAPRPCSLTPAARRYFDSVYEYRRVTCGLGQPAAAAEEGAGKLGGCPRPAAAAAPPAALAPPPQHPPPAGRASRAASDAPRVPPSPPSPLGSLARSHVVLPPDIAKLLPKNRLLSEARRPRPRAGPHAGRAPPPPPLGSPSLLALSRPPQAEWRGIGVQQSRGWVHYAVHRPEPHIMLFRCVRRSKRAARASAGGGRRPHPR